MTVAVVVVRAALSFSTREKLGRDLQYRSPSLSKASVMYWKAHTKPMGNQLIFNPNKETGFSNDTPNCYGKTPHTHTTKPCKKKMSSCQRQQTASEGIIRFRDVVTLPDTHFVWDTIY